MGFYAPAQIVRDARNHGVEIRLVSINHSQWDCSLEPARGRYKTVRLGFRQVRDLANLSGAAIVGARGPAQSESVEEVWRRAGVPRDPAPQLNAMRIVRCADLKSIRDGCNIEVAGAVVVRQRPGSAKGALFVTIEDESGVAQGILWPKNFEIFRRQIMSASMIAIRGRLQKGGRGHPHHLRPSRRSCRDAAIGRPNGFYGRIAPRRWRNSWSWS